MAAWTWTDREVREALGLAVERADPELAYTGISTDSREAEEGHLFVALRGDRFDGHDFVADAAAAGATGAIVSRPASASGRIRLYPVEDTLVALGRLARHRRRALDAPVVGVTGSSGKTTTKDLIRGALGRKYRVHATPGNLNNRVGLPLTLLGTPDDAQVVVLEMGTNEPGEIGILTAIAEPGYGVITTIGEAHLEKLGSVAGVLKEKMALLHGLGEPGVGIVSDEPPELPEAARSVVESLRVAGWSEAADAELRPADPEADSKGRFHFKWEGETVALEIPGRHAVLDALLALAVARELGVTPKAAARGIKDVGTPAMRGEIRSIGSLTVILDCYNANPQSVRASLDLLANHPDLGDRVAVLGSMLELGEGSPELHRAVLLDALSGPLDLVVAVGAFAEAARTLDGPRGTGGDATEGPEVAEGSGMAEGSEIPEVPEPEVAGGDGPRLLVADEVDEVYPLLLPELKGGEVVLLKASRGVELERIVPLLEWDFERGED